MPEYVINTTKEFDKYLEQFKIARGCYNLSAFLDLFKESIEEEYNSLKLYNDSYLVGRTDLTIFLKSMVFKGKLNPTALANFFVGYNRPFTYSLYTEIDKIINMIDKTKYQNKMIKNGIPIREVIVPRGILLHKPQDETKTLIKKYIYIWELYVLLKSVKSNTRLSYDIFKNRLLKDIINKEDAIPLQQLKRIESLTGVIANNDDNFTIAANEYEYDELVSVPFIMHKYICKINNNKLKVGAKRQYQKRIF